ncbi:magnesium transporter NIPA2-like isoform X2 [Strongylocentrotus purpuratus]|uniref:Magnesium transporter NIPA2 n=1 Tax=Strongylocentrotus purpuratus TaxID=7668 RepID=A0A7M7MYA9_STRPU|nr:magnesium transporter NIPA2-like isoform X2 [Strongylocentrotus purpuratus]|eukprot:XP_780841.1 PREDICTED: magnesium transporter NIPA2 isoform X2 [Strongylocentrotus purpuratus]
MGGEAEERSTSDLTIGLMLAVSSTVFIGSSGIVKKKALIKIHAYATRAGDGGHAYLKEWLWWAGFGLLAAGEFLNFIAYAFAPALLVTPLGALSVLVTAVLSHYFLKENLNLLGKVGCMQCIIGSTIMVLHAPVEGGAASLAELSIRLQDSVFVTYIIGLLIVVVVLIYVVSPTHGPKNILVYISICSLVGSLSVLACKGFGIAVKEYSKGTNTFLLPITWFLLSCLVVCILMSMHYLNKALDTFNAAVIAPIYYVFFTTCVVTASGILFKEWASMNLRDTLSTVAGFGVIIMGIYLLHTFKDANISLDSITLMSPKIKDLSKSPLPLSNNHRGVNSSDTESIGK